MDILVNVSNQKLKLETNLHSLVEGSQKFVRFVFDLSSEWDGLLVFAQFTQNGNSYNQYLDDNNCVYLPAEIVAGECTVMLYGSGHTVIGTTNYLTLHINDSILVSDAESTDITESLYNQLVSMVLDMDEKIDKKQNTWFATCSSPAYESKEATTTTGDFVLAAGNSVRVHFSTSNYATNPTLNVDGTGAVDIRSAHTSVPWDGTLQTYTWGVGEVVDFVYDGTYFVIVDGGTATTSVYGVTKLSTSHSSTATDLAATPSAVKAAYDLANGKVSDVEVNGTSTVSGGVASVTVPTATSDLTNDSNFVSDANYVHTDNNYTSSDASKLSGISVGATATSVTQRLQSGTKIAEIEVDGTTTDIYAPSGGGGGGTQNIWYGICTSAGATVAKTVTTTTGDFVLDIGNMVRVRFNKANKASSPTLNVDGTGATAIESITGTAVAVDEWSNGEVIDFVYDGMSFVMSEGGHATVYQYGRTKLLSSISSTATDVAATPSAVKQAYDLADSKVSDVEVNGTSVVSGGVASVTVPTATSDLTNDSNFVSDASYVHTDNNFTNADATKLSGIEAGAEVNVQSDWTQADSTADDYIKNKPTLATVATSGRYGDLIDPPNYATVAYTGDYDDLIDKPTIPTVNNGTLTIQKNGNSVGTFTANQSGNSTANITVPTAVSDLTNDSGFTSVSYTQTLSSGTKIAEIDVDGVTTDIYAPSGGGGGSGVAAGTIVPFGGNVAALPNGWLFCDGSEVSRTTYADLFGAIGTAYGSGDGSTTFNLPDLRGRFAVGVNGSTLPNGANPNLSLYARGATGGSESVTLTTNEIPAHKHRVDYMNYSRGTGSNDTMGYITESQSTSHGHSNTDETGGGQAHENRPPYNAVNYIISTGTGVGTVVNDVEVNGTSVVSGGVADIDLTDYIKEDASGDISITGGADFGDDVNIDGAVNAENLPGIIKMFAGTFAPIGWLLCNGDEVAIEDYPFLYDVIGDTYGTPSDSDHFVLPDFRGRSPLGAGIGTASDATLRTLGQEGGSERITLTADQSGLRAHTHGFTQPSVTGTQGSVSITGGSHSHALSGNNKTVQSGTSYMRPKTYSTSESTVSGYTTSSTTHTHTLPAHTHTIANGAVGAVTGGAVGASESHGNMPPYLTVNYIISTGGVSRWADSAGLPIVRDVTVNGQSVVNNEVAEIARTITLNPTFTTTTGAMQISMARQSGKVVWLSIAVNNSASVAAGGNVYVGDVAGIPFPPRVTSAGGYYGSNAMAGSIAENGHIVIRNASSSAVTISGDNTVTISFTYVVD